VVVKAIRAGLIFGSINEVEGVVEIMAALGAQEWPKTREMINKFAQVL
jgi:hypothetical protein